MFAAVRCDECGYDYDTFRQVALARRIVDLAHDTARVLLATTPSAARRRPADGVWSPLEYCCHVRDILLFQGRRVRLAQDEDEPTFAPMNRDERAVAERYNEQDVPVVAGETAAAAEDLAGTLEALPRSGWQRTGWYGHPKSQLVTVEWIARHTVHELHHHLLDINRQVRLTAG